MAASALDLVVLGRQLGLGTDRDPRKRMKGGTWTGRSLTDNPTVAAPPQSDAYESVPVNPSEAQAMVPQMSDARPQTVVGGQNTMAESARQMLANPMRLAMGMWGPGGLGERKMGEAAETASHPGEVYAGRADPYDTDKAMAIVGAMQMGGMGGTGAGGLGSGMTRRRGGYQDPTGTKIDDWSWRPQEEVAAELGLSGAPLPAHIKPFANFMSRQQERAGSGDMNARDLLKAYTTTRASIQRGAVDTDKVRSSSGMPLEGHGATIRPEGAWGEWLLSGPGQQYLDQGVKGKLDPAVVRSAQDTIRPFGKADIDVPDAMRWGVENLPGREGRAAQLIAAGARMQSPTGEWRDFTKDWRGIGPAKSGFVASLLGRGDMATPDARQLILQTGRPTKEASRFMARSGGQGGIDASERLGGRMDDLALRMDPEHEPSRRHLTHHAVWDKVGNDATTHEDIIRSMTLGSGLTDRKAAAAAGMGLMGGGESRTMTGSEIGNAVRALGPMYEKSWNKLDSDSSGLGAGVPHSAAADTITAQHRMRPEGVQDEIPRTAQELHRMRARIIPAIGDITMGHADLTHINGKPLDHDVRLEGGQSFARGPAGTIWASGDQVIAGLHRTARAEAEHGDPVMLAYTSMGNPTSSDFSTMNADALLALRSRYDPSKDGLRELDDKVRKVDPGFPGLYHDEAREYLLNSPSKPRKALMEEISKATPMKAGLPDPALARFGTTDPSLLGRPYGMSGHSISQVDTAADAITSPPMPHGTYPHQLAGKYWGSMEPVPREVMWSDWHNKRGNTAEKDRQAFLTQSTTYKADRRPTQLADDQWLEGVMRWYEQQQARQQGSRR